MSKYKVTLLVSSCDKDADTWFPFFKLFQIYWKDYPSTWKIVLNTETMNYQHDGLDIYCYGGGKRAKSLSWTERLYRVVSECETDYIFLTLGDYFITEKVNQDKIEYCLNQMELDPTIGYMCFFPVESPRLDEEAGCIDGFVKCVKGSSFSINAQAGLWRKEYLSELLRMKRSPWEWELLGSELSLWLEYDIYKLKDNVALPYPYDWRADGISVYCRKWTKRCIAFFEQHDIDIDFNIRGVWTGEQNHSPTIIKKDLRYYMRRPLLKRIKGFILRKVK